MLISTSAWGLQWRRYGEDGLLEGTSSAFTSGRERRSSLPARNVRTAENTSAPKRTPSPDLTIWYW